LTGNEKLKKALIETHIDDKKNDTIIQSQVRDDNNIGKQNNNNDYKQICQLRRILKGYLKKFSSQIDKAVKKKINTKLHELSMDEMLEMKEEIQQEIFHSGFPNFLRKTILQTISAQEHLISAEGSAASLMADPMADELLDEISILYSPRFYVGPELRFVVRILTTMQNQRASNQNLAKKFSSEREIEERLNTIVDPSLIKELID
jgi:hypothetical protein